ncbi:hypothetical protein ACVWZV_009222 [Bradyrhizobium sp. GM5.1]
MSSNLVRALLKEVPLAHIEIYLQVLDSGILQGRSAKEDDNGTVCGGGCDSKGGACGAWCAAAELHWGHFDVTGQSDVTKADFHAAIANPAAFRKALTAELDAAARAIGAFQGPVLARTIDPQLYVNRG